MNNFQFVYLISIILIIKTDADILRDRCPDIHRIELNDLKEVNEAMIPELNGASKGDAGRIGVIGGSVEYTGAPYFSAISALRVGADLVYVITTESAAPIIKSYSPDLIVYPFLNTYSASKLNIILSKMDVVVIGPGLGREENTIKLTREIIETCKSLNKSLVIDADGLHAVMKNISILRDYPSPGVILTPNQKEEMRLMDAVYEPHSGSREYRHREWYSYWGPFVTVLSKGEEDRFLTSRYEFMWSSSEGGSGRRAGGQGDILSGSLGTFFKWALDHVNKPFGCRPEILVQFAHSLATYAAARLTRDCNSRAYREHGRGMIASDMLKEIPKAFRDRFN